MATNDNDRKDRDSGRGAGDSKGSGDAQKPARREITGPGAADFLAAPGGLDLPENDPGKGMRGAREDGTLTDERRLTPNLDEPAPTTEREILPRDSDKRRDSN
jgi:hypothetical protein